MKNIKIYLTCGTITIIALILWTTLNKSIQSVPQSEIAIEKSKQIEKKPTLIPVKQSRYYVKPKIIPLKFTGFHDMKHDKRLIIVTKLMKNKNLSEDNLDFLKAEIFNRNHKSIIRNNMSNALCWQHKPDPELHKLFIKMLDDEHEDPIWRDYCIQFLTECYDSSNNKPLIIDTLKHYSKGDDSKAGTALIHLAMHEEKIEKIDSDHMLKQLENSKTSIHTRTAILAVWGKSNDKTKLSVIRKYATQDKDAALKAVAIGSLGLISDDEAQDLKIVNLALYHNNGRVVLAARAAKTRIEKRIILLAE